MTPSLAAAEAFMIGSEYNMNIALLDSRIATMKPISLNRF